MNLKAKQIKDCWPSPAVRKEVREQLATPKYTFWDICFKLVIKEQMIQKEPLTLHLYLLKEI